MESIGAYEAKTHLPRLLAEVEQGKSFEITKHGRAVALLTPSGPQRTPTEDLLAQFDALRSELGSWASLEEITEWKNEGRR